MLESTVAGHISVEFRFWTVEFKMRDVNHGKVSIVVCNGVSRNALVFLVTSTQMNYSNNVLSSALATSNHI